LGRGGNFTLLPDISEVPTLQTVTLVTPFTNYKLQINLSQLATVEAKLGILESNKLANRSLLCFLDSTIDVLLCPRSIKAKKNSQTAKKKAKTKYR